MRQCLTAKILEYYYSIGLGLL